MSKIMSPPPASAKVTTQTSLPRVFHQAIRLITRSGINEEGIFRISGNKETVAQLKERIDRGEDIDFVKEQCVPFDVAALMKMFLREMPDPMLQGHLYDQWLATLTSDDPLSEVKVMLKKIPIDSQKLLETLIPFLYKIGLNSSINKMDFGNLSKTVGPNLLWKVGASNDPTAALLDSNKINDVVSIMIENAEAIWPDQFNGDGGKWATWNAKLYGHTKSVQALGIGRDQEEIWSFDSKGQVIVWCAQTYKKLRQFDTQQNVVTTTYSPEPHDFIWSGAPQTIKIWNTKTYEEVKELKIGGFCFVNIGEQVFIGTEGGIHIYNSTTYEKEGEISLPGLLVRAMEADEKNLWAATTHREVFIHIIDIQTRAVTREIKEGHTKSVNGFTRFAGNFWTAGNDHMCVFDANGGLVKTITHNGGHTGAILSVATFGNHVWSLGWDTSIRIWEVKSIETSLSSSLTDLKTSQNGTTMQHKMYKPVFSMDAHNDCVESVEFIYDKERKCWKAWTGSFDKAVCVFGISPTYDLTEPPKEEPKPVEHRSSSPEPVTTSPISDTAQSGYRAKAGSWRTGVSSGAREQMRGFMTERQTKLGSTENLVGQQSEGNSSPELPTQEGL
ncbi:RhoGAP domain-containing protein, partial [Planoprotostelium fungivorum]